MSSLFSIPGAIFAGLMAIATISAAIAVVRSSYAKARIEALSGDRDDYEKRLIEIRTEYKECRDNYEKLQVKLDAETKRREALEQVVTGKRELELVLQILTEQDERMSKVHDMVREILRRGDH